MSCYRYSSAEVADDEVEFFICFAKLLCCLAGNRLVVERMEERLSLKAFQSESGVSCERLHFIYTYRIYKERRNSYRVSQFF